MLSGNFNHFSYFSKRINEFLNIELKDNKLEEYKDKFQGLLDNFQDRCDDLLKLKPYFVFLVDLCMVDVVNDDCLLPKPLVTESSAVEMQLMDLGLKTKNKFQSTIEF